MFLQKRKLQGITDVTTRKVTLWIHRQQLQVLCFQIKIFLKEFKKDTFFKFYLEKKYHIS